MEVRKTVTCFADVTGSTALGERLDPESMRGVMSWYFEEMGSARSSPDPSRMAAHDGDFDGSSGIVDAGTTGSAPMG